MSVTRNSLQAPFPWFGGKSRVASFVWSRFGDLANYVEPFFGSGAVLLGRPSVPRIETVNDKDGFVANFWRALAADPGAVASFADWPVNENDQHARHSWLVARRASLTARLEGDPLYFDAQIAGWWVWGLACWIGAGWCSGEGGWTVEDGQLVHLGDAGRGVQRQLVHLGNAGRGVQRKRAELTDWFTALAERLAGVRVCCGDWARVLGPTPTAKLGITGVFLDPPYADDEREGNLYSVDSGTVAADARAWAIAHGDDPDLRIALCGYAGEHTMPDSWECVPWKAHGGYGSQGDGRGRANAGRERIWFNPACVSVEHLPLFASLTEATVAAQPTQLGWEENNAD